MLKNTFWYKTIKRAVDIGGSLLGIIALLPFLFFIALLIKLDSRGPVFFIQERCGRGGRGFGMFKFRTMVENAEEMKRDLHEKNEVNGPMFKIFNDPRVTRLGMFLRATKLDELPQLWNVLKGEMSLVGPRPLAYKEMDGDPEWREFRLTVKPGMTGAWQVNNGDYRSFEEWVYWDTFYVKNRSLLLDLRIIIKTVSMMAVSLIDIVRPKATQGRKGLFLSGENRDDG